MSSFVWIDHSEKQRRQVLEAIDLFREKDTRDELGVAGVRDAISDAFFPGTGALQTRARYFFFNVWMFQQFEGSRTAPTDISRKVRDFEVRLIDTLAQSSDPAGTIGIQARKALQRFPSSIYWNGLKVLKIANLPGSVVDYYRAMNRPVQGGRRELVNDDGEKVAGRSSPWHAQMPKAPATFPDAADFVMTSEEGSFLKDQVLTHYPASLFAYFLNQGIGDSDYLYAWDHPALTESPARLLRQVEMCRVFSEVMNGAAILYNLGLARLEPRRPDYIEDISVMLGEWQGLLDSRQDALQGFRADEFWRFIRECGHVPSMQTTAFVDAWFALASDAGRRKSMASDERAVGLVFGRERQIKGPMARCENRRVREIWQGDAGLRRLVYRWPNAEVLLNDIAASLGAARA